MAESGELDVTVHGKSAHAGKYHEGIDSIVIASFWLVIIKVSFHEWFRQCNLVF